MLDADTPLPPFTRLWFAWVCFFRVLLDGAFARRAYAAAATPEALPPAPDAPRRLSAPPEEAPVKRPSRRPSGPPISTDGPPPTPALQLLAALQREGRFVDFLEQDVAGFSDSEVGAVARVVHEGCRRALRQHMTFVSVRSESEDTAVEIAAGYSPAEIKLTGNVQGSAPYRGTLRHRGWRAKDVTLPTPVAGHDPEVIAPAEVEL